MKLMTASAPKLLFIFWSKGIRKL